MIFPAKSILNFNAIYTRQGKELGEYMTKLLEKDVALLMFFFLFLALSYALARTKIELMELNNQKIIKA